MRTRSRHISKSAKRICAAFIPATAVIRVALCAERHRFRHQHLMNYWRFRTSRGSAAAKKARRKMSNDPHLQYWQEALECAIEETPLWEHYLKLDEACRREIADCLAVSSGQVSMAFGYEHIPDQRDISISELKKRIGELEENDRRNREIVRIKTTRDDYLSAEEQRIKSFARWPR